MRAFSRKLAYVVGYQLYCSNNMIVYFAYSERTGQQTIVAIFDQDVNAFIEVLTKWSLMGAKIQRRRQLGKFTKVVAVAYSSGRLRELLITEFK